MNIIPTNVYNAITEAYCKSMNCGIPRETCLSLGKCEECDNFEKELTKIDNDKRGH